MRSRPFHAVQTGRMKEIAAYFGKIGGKLCNGKAAEDPESEMTENKNEERELEPPGKVAFNLREQRAKVRACVRRPNVTRHILFISKNMPLQQHAGTTNSDNLKHMSKLHKKAEI